ncbi:MAG: DNA-3-methyladenine glycosylase I [Acidimicrobiia bacterium]|nr:DNA-3-methyladenine glycosylase I [Acidimicrobiia bacterium]
MSVVTGDDGARRCWWGAGPDIYRAYHDDEWGRPVTDDSRLFEKVSLEGFQAGLSWLTILTKRENFRAAFADFDPATVARFSDHDVSRLLADKGIVRHEGKIRSTINNARRALDLIEEKGSLSRYFWRWAEDERPPPPDLPAWTESSKQLSEDLKKRGWTFVGPTTIYAFMQAMGLVNDHLDGCDARDRCVRERRHVMRSRI